MTALELLALFDTGSVTNWIEYGGYFMLFGLLFACGVGLPLPEDIPLIVAGYLVSQEKMDLVPAAVLAWCGIIGGDLVLYHLGKKLGLEVTRLPLIGKHATKERILKLERLFANWGVWVVAACRLFAGVRFAMVVAAGAIRYNRVKFIIADGLAALVSGGLWVAGGYFLGRKFGSPAQIKAHLVRYEEWVYLTVAVLVVGIVLYVWWRRRRHKPPVLDKALDKVVEESNKHPIHPPPD